MEKKGPQREMVLDDKVLSDKACSDIPLSDSLRQRCEIWTRVMGYHRPVASFNKGKKSEHSERQHFREGQCQLQMNRG